jgi:hypothetical protein
MSYGLDGWGFDSRQGQEIYFYSTASTTVLGHTQPFIQWVTGTLSPVVKRLARATNHSLPSSVEIERDGGIPHLPIHIRDLALNKLRSGRTLPFTSPITKETPGFLGFQEQTTSMLLSL